MQTTGPFTPVAGTPLVEYDPARYTAANVAVQVQNYSGLTLTCVIGGWSYLVAPFTATTFPTYQAPQIVMTPAGTISTAAGDVALVWLQPGERSPIADGSLVAYSPQGFAVTAPLTATFLTTNPPLSTLTQGYDTSSASYVIDLLPLSQGSVVYLWFGWSGTGTPTITVTGNQSGTVYFSGYEPAGGIYAITVTSPLDTSLTLATNGAAATLSVGYGPLSSVSPSPYSPAVTTPPLPPTAVNATLTYRIVTSTAASVNVVNLSGQTIGSINLDQSPGLYVEPLIALSPASQAGLLLAGPGQGTTSGATGITPVKDTWHFVSLSGTS